MAWRDAWARRLRGFWSFVWPTVPRRLTHRLARELEQVEHSEPEYREHESLHRKRLEKLRRRGELAGVAAETWILLSFEIRLRHHEAAHRLFDAGLDALPHADDETLQLAIELIRLLASQETERDRLAAAATIYERAIAACGQPTRVEARLRLYVALARLLLGTSAEAAAVVATENALAVAAELSAGPPLDPYREAEQRRTAPSSSPIRASVVTLVAIRISALATLGRFADAEDSALAASDLLPGGLSADESAELRSTQAFIAFRAGDYRAAERLYGELVGDGEPDGHALRALPSLGWTYLRLGLVDEAAGLAKRIMQKDSTSAGAGALRAAAELARGQLDAAEVFARQVTEPGTSNALARAAALRVIAEVELARGDHGAALAAAEAALDLMRATTGPNDQYTSDQLVTLARVEAAAGRPTAESRFQQALALDMPEDHPRRATILEAYASHLAGAGRAREAETLRARAHSIAAARLAAPPR